MCLPRVQYGTIELSFFALLCPSAGECPVFWRRRGAQRPQRRAVETGGRWGPEPTAFVRLLAQARAASAHAAVRSALRAAYVSRWSGIIAVAAQRALASSLLELPLDTVASAAGEPAVHEVPQDERWLDAPASSRLAARTQVVLVPRSVQVHWDCACHCRKKQRVYSLSSDNSRTSLKVALHRYPGAAQQRGCAANRTRNP